MKFDANGLFEQELARRGLAYVREDESAYRIQLDGGEVVANLTNIIRNAERDDDVGVIARYLDQVIGAIRATIPEWREASHLLFFSAEPADQDFGEAVTRTVTEEVARVLTLTDAQQSRLTWVTPQMCSTWGVTPAEASAMALTNQDTLLDGLELQFDEVDGHRLGMIPLDSPYKASVIFAPRFKQCVQGALGWPVLVVVPCRDFIYVVSDNSPLLNRMGSVVVREFSESGYPITTEVIRVSDEGLSGIGKFPV